MTDPTFDIDGYPTEEWRRGGHYEYRFPLAGEE